MKSIITVWLSIILTTFCIAGNAQVLDQVTFTDIRPTTPFDDGIVESRSFTFTNSGNVGTLFFSGTITPLDDNATLNSFASDFVFDIIGPELEIISIQFSNIDNLSEARSFEGSVNIIRSVEEGDIFTFNFFDNFDDGSISANASIDVTFEFNSDDPLGPFIVPDLPDGIDQVIFNTVEPSNANAPVETRTFTVNNSGEVQGLFFTGRIISLDPGAFPSDFIVNISGPNFTAQNIRFSTEAESFQSVLFEGSVNVDGTITQGDQITFDFIDTFDDGFIETNAIIDIAFVFLDEFNIISPTVNDFGNFTLDQGFYDRGFEDGINDHPFTTVEFEVSSDGTYSIESIWGLDNFENQFDGFLYIFDQPFDGIDDSNNIAFNDFFFDISTSRIDGLFLQKGIVYTALLTSFQGEEGNTDLQGNLRVISTVGNSASLIEEEAELCFPIRAKNNNVVMICF